MFYINQGSISPKNKTKVISMNFTKLLQSRVSTRAFRPDPVAADDVKKILDAALYAPVGMHRYETLHLSVITDKAIFARIRDKVVQETGDTNADPLHGAPLLIVVSTSLEGEIGALNVSCLVENMLLAAADLGLGNLYVRGAIHLSAKDQTLVKDMGIPNGFTPMASVAIGYSVEKIIPRERPKNDVTDICFIKNTTK